MSIHDRSEMIYLSPPHIGEREHQYVEDAFRSNWIAPLGPHVDAFEQEIARYAGVRGALAVSSGTAALHLALRLAGVQAGDKVICSSLTFVASANPILYLGAEPIFVDSQPESWNLCPQAFARACRELAARGTPPKAAVVVNLYGQSADLAPIAKTCAQYGIVLIEDAAESLGATYYGKASGSMGKFSFYSFNGNKIITTSGGGMLVSDDVEALHKARFWATQARDPARHYQHSESGYNYRLSNVLAAIGRGQLEMLEERIARRRQIFQTYYDHLSGFPGITFMPEMTYGRSTRWLTALTIDPAQSGVTVESLSLALERRRIEARPVWKPLHAQPLFAKYDYYPYRRDFSVSDRLFACGMCLPSGSNLTEHEQLFVIETIVESLPATRMIL